MIPKLFHSEQRYRFCHFCLGKAWATPEPHRRINGVRVPLKDIDMNQKDNGVLVESYVELLDRSDTPQHQ